ncbi:MAG: dipeptidase [Simkania sp.]|nr:dipeptidase [Simkania sp.]
MGMATLEDYRTWFHARRKEILEEYFTLLRFPSISTDPAYKKDVQACAEWLKAYLDKMGLTTELWPTSVNPVLFASCMKAGPDRPTLLIYNHYDVQPVDPLELWKSQPFAPEIRDGKVYARGASDNKGQLFYVLSAVRAFLELSKEHRLNLKMFIEGEEEFGSMGSREVLKTKKEQLKADYCLILDAGLPKPGVPGVTLGLRGIVTMNVKIQNSSGDLHSGLFGGIVMNPLQALSTALAGLWEHGKVAVPGFYKDVVEISLEDWQMVDHSFDKEEFIRSFGIKAFGGESGYTLLESSWVRPTVEINGMSGGYTGKGFKTVIPSEAYAKISCRLVPNQDPDTIGKLLAEYIRGKLPQGFHCEIEVHSGGLPVRTSAQSSLAQTVKRAYEAVFEQPCQFIFCSASVPIVADLAKASESSVALMGTATNEDDIHAPNEHFGLNQFELGFLTMAKTLSLIAEN